MLSARRYAWLVLPALALFPAGTALADGSSSAEASAAHVEGGENGENSASVGHTSADSGSGQYEAEAFAANGEPAHERTGGSAGTGAQSEGAAFDSEAEGGEEFPLKIAVMPWSADGVNGESSAALLVLKVTDADGASAAELYVLHSQSKAFGTASSAHSDAALLRLGGDQFEAHILHAEADNQGGVTYLVGIQDNQIASSEQAGESCTLSVPDVADLSCLVVRQEGPEVLAAVAEATLGGGQLDAGLFQALASGQQASPSPLPAPDDFGAPEVSPVSGELPRTGESTALRLIAALVLAGAGVTGFALSRERSPDLVTSLR